MNFADEPAAGENLPILPGHFSPGRFERVLRAGQFAVTAEIAPLTQLTPMRSTREPKISMAMLMPSMQPTALAPIVICRAWAFVPCSPAWVTR